MTDPAETEAGTWRKESGPQALVDYIDGKSVWLIVPCADGTPDFWGPHRFTVPEWLADTILRDHALAAKVAAVEKALEKIADFKPEPSRINEHCGCVVTLKAIARAALDDLHSAEVGR